jgi:hypothetical protein
VERDAGFGVTISASKRPACAAPVRPATASQPASGTLARMTRSAAWPALVLLVLLAAGCGSASQAAAVDAGDPETVFAAVKTTEARAVPTPTPTPAVSEQAMVDAYMLVRAADEQTSAGQLGLAIESLRQALATWPDYPGGGDLLAHTGATATAQAATAVAQLTAVAVQSRAQATSSAEDAATAQARQAGAQATAQSQSRAVELLGAAVSERGAGKLGIALELARQAQGTWPEYGDARRFLADVAPRATATQQAALAQATAQARGASPAQTDVAAAALRPYGSVAIGEIGVLRSGAGDVLVGGSEQALDDAARAAARNDRQRLARLLMDGALFSVPQGTPARLLGTSGLLASKLNVRILDGPYAARSVWIPGEWLQPP